MYNLFSKTTALLGLLTIGLMACDKDEDQVVSAFGAAPALTTQTRTVVLLQTNAEQPALTYSWTPYAITLSDGSTPVSPVTYTLQFARAGTDFAPATTQEISAGSGSASTLAIRTVDLNTVLLGLELPFTGPSQVDVRLRTSVAGNIAPLFSATSTLTATPYNFCAQPTAGAAWSLIGPAGQGWGTDIAMTYDCATRTYTYTGPLNADKFKFRYGGNTAIAWRANLGGTSSTGGALTQNGPDLEVAEAGNYTIVLTPGALAANGEATGGTFTIQKK